MEQNPSEIDQTKNGAFSIAISYQSVHQHCLVGEVLPRSEHGNTAPMISGFTKIWYNPQQGSHETYHYPMLGHTA